MRLTLKLALALLPGILVVLAASAYLEMRRDVATFDIDSRQDDMMIGKVVTSAINRIWDIGGHDQAVEFAGDASACGRATHRFRWLEADELRRPGSAPSELPPESMSALARGDEVWSEKRQPSPGTLFVYAPLLRNGSLAGVLEISEPLTNQRRYAERIGLSTVLTTISLAAVYLLMTTVLGAWLVGRPIKTLISKARRVGAGDFSGQLDLRYAGEIGELGAEMNLMSERLAEAGRQVSTATTAQIAAIEQVRHADRLSTVGKLASGIAHELGTPLNVVSGRAQLIQESVPAGGVDKMGAADLLEVADHARIIVEQSRRMSAIIRQLLDFARRRGVQKAAYDLRQLVDQTVSMLQNLAGRRNVTVAVQPTDSPVFAQVDASQIQQVLTNVVVNAIQSMLKGGTVTISIRPSSARLPPGTEIAESERWEIAVNDEGEGMAPEVLPHVFEPFFTTKAVGEATGLGLSVAYGIVQEHGGFITVESQLGKGSRFAIHLPKGEA